MNEPNEFILRGDLDEVFADRHKRNAYGAFFKDIDCKVKKALARTEWDDSEWYRPEGYASTMFLNVSSNSPVEYLRFFGSHPIFVDDRIRASVIAIEHRDSTSKLFPRELRKYEHPYAITKLSKSLFSGRKPVAFYENGIKEAYSANFLREFEVKPGEKVGDYFS